MGVGLLVFINEKIFHHQQVSISKCPFPFSLGQRLGYDFMPRNKQFDDLGAAFPPTFNGKISAAVIYHITSDSDVIIAVTYIAMLNNVYPIFCYLHFFFHSALQPRLFLQENVFIIFCVCCGLRVVIGSTRKVRGQ